MVTEIFLGICIVLLIVNSIYTNKIKKDLIEKTELIIQLQSLDIYEYDEVKENFLKFVSDSREWAFDYIENVQSEISETIKILDEPIEKVYNKKRKSSDEKVLLEAYNKLKSLLPEQGN